MVNDVEELKKKYQKLSDDTNVLEAKYRTIYNNIICDLGVVERVCVVIPKKSLIDLISDKVIRAQQIKERLNESGWADYCGVNNITCNMTEVCVEIDILERLRDGRLLGQNKKVKKE